MENVHVFSSFLARIHQMAPILVGDMLHIGIKNNRLRWKNVSEFVSVDLNSFLALFITRDNKFQKLEGLGLELLKLPGWDKK